MCLERFRKGLKTKSVYPDLVQHVCAAQDVEKASKHKRLPRSSSTSMCCERFREGPKTQAFALILFNTYVLREI